MDFVILIIILFVWLCNGAWQSMVKSGVKYDIKKSEEQAKQDIKEMNEFIEKYTNEEFENEYWESNELKAEKEEIIEELKGKFNDLKNYYTAAKMVLFARRGFIPKELTRSALDSRYNKFIRYYNSLLIKYGVPGLFMYKRDKYGYFITHTPEKAIIDTTDADYEEYKLISWREIVFNVSRFNIYLR